MLNYAARVPADSSGLPLESYPAAKIHLPQTTTNAPSVLSMDNGSFSSVMTLNDNTTVLEIAATNAAAVLRWVPVGETAAAPAAGPFQSVITVQGTANFDHVIPKDSVRRFVVPIETRGSTSVVGLNIQNGLYNKVAVKSFGIGSVSTLQF